jgi:hypothetical protein
LGPCKPDMHTGPVLVSARWTTPLDREKFRASPKEEEQWGRVGAWKAGRGPCNGVLSF